MENFLFFEGKTKSNISGKNTSISCKIRSKRLTVSTQQRADVNKYNNNLQFKFLQTENVQKK